MTSAKCGLLDDKPVHCKPYVMTGDNGVAFLTVTTAYVEPYPKHYDVSKMRPYIVRKNGMNNISRAFYLP